jgi:hypothetical protein
VIVTQQKFNGWVTARRPTRRVFAYTVVLGSEGKSRPQKVRSLMRNRRKRDVAVVGLLCLALVLTVSPVAAAPGGNGNGNGNGGSNGNGGNGNGNGSTPLVLNATPELDSLMLFGAGAAGLASYALMRLRAGRRPDKETD